MSDESVKFLSRDGLELEGTLRPVPGVVEPSATALLIHGITSEQHESGFYTSLANKLGESDVPSLRFNWRCHGGNSLPQREMTLFGIVNDIHAAFRYLRSRYPVAATSLHVVAASFGGGASILWATRQKDAHVSSAALLAPVIDYGADLFRAGEIDEDYFLRHEEAKTLELDGAIPTTSLPVGRALINELPHFDCAAAFKDAEYPITIFHGGSDSDVPFASSERYVATNPSAKLRVVPDVDHGFVVPGSEFTDGVNRETHDRVTSWIHDEITKSLKR